MTMKCPVCGEAELLKETRDLPFTFKAQTTVIVGVSGEFCPACNESILDLPESSRVMHEIQAFSRLVNAPQKAANA